MFLKNNNKQTAWLLAAVLAAATGSAKELTLDDVFPTDRVLDVQITVAEKDWGKIRHQARNFISALHEDRKTAPIDGPYEYVTADVTIWERHYAMAPRPWRHPGGAWGWPAPCAARD